MPLLGLYRIVMSMRRQNCLIGTGLWQLQIASSHVRKFMNGLMIPRGGSGILRPPFRRKLAPSPKSLLTGKLVMRTTPAMPQSQCGWGHVLWRLRCVVPIFYMEVTWVMTQLEWDGTQARVFFHTINSLFRSLF